MASSPRTPADERLAALLTRRDDVVDDEDDGADLYDERWVPRAARGDSASPDDRSARSGRAHHRAVTVPDSLRGARLGPGPWAIAGVAVLLVVAAVVFGVRAWAAQERSRPAAVSADSTRGGDRSARGGPTGSSGPSASPTSSAASMTTAPGTSPAGGTIGGPAPTQSATTGPAVVHVAGAVRRPGVVTLPAGSRVVDAVERCGGALPSADLATVNLARTVADGEQIVVTVRGQAPVPAAAPSAPGSDASRGSGAPGSTPSGSGTSATGAPSGAPIDLNSADIAALDTLPGVGPVMAQRIVDYRTQNGRFTSVEQLGEVEGVGDKTLQRLTPLVRV